MNALKNTNAQADTPVTRSGGPQVKLNPNYSSSKSGSLLKRDCRFCVRR